MTDIANSAAPSRPLVAAAYMVGTLLSFLFMSVAAREASAELSTFEMLGYRSLIGLVIVSACIYWISSRGFRQVTSQRYPLHAGRVLVHFGAQNCWFFAIATIPLAQVTALELSSPIWVALLAPFFLGEQLTRTRLFAALIGFLGILLIARPGVSPLELGHLAAFCAAIGFAINTLAVKRLSATETILCILFWMTLGQMILGFGFAAPGGISLFSWSTAPWVLALGITGLSAHFCLTKALSHAPASLVAPMEFVRLPLIALVGLALYGEAFEIAVLLGGLLVFSANMVNIQAERQKSK